MALPQAHDPIPRPTATRPRTSTDGKLRTTLDRIVAESTQRVSDLADNLDVGLAAPAFPARMPLNVLVVRCRSSRS